MQIDYIFNDEQLLKKALTHPSSVKKKDGWSLTYERMEFLGDKVLSMIIGEMIYKKFPEISEGGLSIIHSNLVNTGSISKIASGIDLGSSLILDVGEEESGGRRNARNLENAMESLIAAIFLDSDYPTVKNFVEKLWSNLLLSEDITKKNSKSLLQEWVQKQKLPLPEYIIENKEGPDHFPTFEISVMIKGIGKICAQGNSVKETEQLVAKKALQALEKK